MVVDHLESRFRFPGQIVDPESGLYYNWHKFYNPETGRYISADPIGLTGGLNLYAYIGNDPVNLIDPWGLAGFGSCWDERLVPDNPDGVTFSYCCYYHDECYTDELQPICDLEFKQCLRERCDNIPDDDFFSYKPTSSEDDKQHHFDLNKRECNQYATLYYKAVNELGAGAWEEAQKNTSQRLEMGTLETILKGINMTTIPKTQCVYSYLLFLILVFFCLHFLTSCFLLPTIRYNKIIPASSILWGGYTHGSTYKLKIESFIQEISTDFNSRTTSNPNYTKTLLNNAKILVPPQNIQRGGRYLTIKTIDQYVASKQDWPYILGVVSIGTSIEAIKLIEYVPVGHKSSLYTYGRILDGPFKGHLVEISDLSIINYKTSQPHPLSPNLRFLEKQ